MGGFEEDVMPLRKEGMPGEKRDEEGGVVFDDGLGEALRELVAQFKAALVWQRRYGVWWVPASPLPQRPRAAAQSSASQVIPKGGHVNERVAALIALREEAARCTKGRLASSRLNVVFGRGDPYAEVMFVGEGPGADEDRMGEPFVGAAGKLLDRMIAAMGLGREEVYICNIVKCRPPGNRDPAPDEVEACNPFLKGQIALVQPKLIVTLGKPAAHCLLRSDAPIGALRGRWHEYEGIPVMPTYHPAALLRNASYKRPAWEDLKMVMARMDSMGLKRQRG